MARDKGKYQLVDNPDSSFFEIDEQEDEHSLNTSGINAIKNSFPSSSVHSGTSIFQNSLKRKRRLFFAFGAIFGISLLSLLFLRFGLKPDNSDPDNQTDNVPPPTVEDSSDRLSDEKAGDDGKPRLSIEDMRSGQFYPQTTYIGFIEPPVTKSPSQSTDEGLYYIVENQSIKARKAGDPTFEKILTSSTNFTYDSKSFNIYEFIPAYDLDYAIIVTDLEAEWRHSSYSYYWIYSLEQDIIIPLKVSENGELVKVSFGSWSPNYNYISYVYNNNVYIKKILDLSESQVTSDGSDLVFNGKPDWVYEEEVLGSDRALWWAPDEANLIFLRLDDSAVPQYNLDYYVNDGDIREYPQSKKLLYPKPGFQNPQASLYSYNLQSDIKELINRDDSQLKNDFIVYDAFFLNPSEFIVKETDRESKILNYRKFNPQTRATSVFYEIKANETYNGWIEKSITPLIINKDGINGFVDILVVDGFNHLVWFPGTEIENPTTLTSGKWEVSNNKIVFNRDLNEVLFFANKYSSIDKHLFAVNLDSKIIEDKITESSSSSYYSGQFSFDGKFIVLNYEGPGIPNSNLLEIESGNVIKSLSNSKILEAALNTYSTPEKRYHRVEVGEIDGDQLEVNVIESLPPYFDPTKKYPLLVHYYAGPGSQVVFSKFSIGFEDVISSALEAVILYVEPRGTGGQGWKYRSWAKDKIGYWEPRDITSVAKKWINEDNSYIDSSKTAIWGWSYGGWTTLDTLQYDAGETFRYGMAVAPVTNWLFYDSIYTERYMGLPEYNQEGYKNSQITNYDNLKKVERFLVMHGTADDNVHAQNTYWLLDHFDLKEVTNYDVKIFPDNDHSIRYHNANKIVYDKLFNWLKDAFSGEFLNLTLKK
ncbi:hypothetical protein WICMUC_003542 [Wickerhamomyces mucosus]|uniref:Dipeptidyl aminopeptidase A n=1 Tax=Wickerhamomyces mucosus TaxID=1378264 RepID=A0A9P8TCF8_9ASCO|nr:hypothetical protein WICMUC_003542 [Wickerhamomyces mucosus]